MAIDPGHIAATECFSGAGVPAFATGQVTGAAQSGANGRAKGVRKLHVRAGSGLYPLVLSDAEATVCDRNLTPILSSQRLGSGNHQTLPLHGVARSRTAVYGAIESHIQPRASRHVRS